MPKIEIPLDTGYYESYSTPIANQGCVNMYPQNPQTKGATSNGALFPTHGIKKFVEVTDICRGMHVFEEKLFSVNGNNLYLIESNGTCANKGSISGNGRVSIADNGVTMCIVVPSGDAYFYFSSTLHKITDAVFLSFASAVGGVTSVTSKDGYFIYTTRKEFFISSVSTTNGGRSFDALDFSTAERKPDPIVRAMVIRNELYIFGTLTIEIFQNIGGDGFPFQRVNGATIDKGLTARFSAIEFDNSFVFIGSADGEKPSIWRGSGGGAQKISTSAIDSLLSSYADTDLADAFSFKYAMGGSFFVGFTVKDKTIVYDATSSAMQQRPVWHERSTNNSVYRVNEVKGVYGKVFVGDNQGGLIGTLEQDLFTEYGETVERQFTSMYLQNEGTSLFISDIELKTESGVGLFKENKTGVNPVINMKYSDDGGKTYKDAGNKRIGRQGEYNIRQIWRRQGRTPYTRLFRFTITEPIKTVFIKLVVRLNGGTNG